MGNVMDSDKTPPRSGNLKVDIAEPTRARKYLIKLFNEIGLEFISTRKDYSSYIFVVIKFKDVRLKNIENSLFKREIIAQTSQRPCSRNPFKIVVPVYSEVENGAIPQYILWCGDEALPANPFDTSFIVAIDSVLYGV